MESSKLVIHKRKAQPPEFEAGQWVAVKVYGKYYWGEVMVRYHEKIGPVYDTTLEDAVPIYYWNWRYLIYSEALWEKYHDWYADKFFDDFEIYSEEQFDIYEGPTKIRPGGFFPLDWVHEPKAVGLLFLFYVLFVIIVLLWETL